MPESPTVSIIVPTLNEAENIPELLTELNGVLSQPDFPAAEILFADGGSTDDTAGVASDFATENDLPVRVISCGQGSLSQDALYAGREARGEVVVVMDADLSHPPGSLPELVGPVVEGDRDMVVGSRYVEGGEIENWPLRRRLISSGATWVARLFANVNDPLSGFFAVRREAFLEYGEAAEGYKIGLEILARGEAELRVEEVPIRFQDREQGESELSLAVVTTFLSQLIKLAGGNITPRKGVQFGFVGLLGMLVDLSVFYGCWYSGLGLTLSHLSGFVSATIFNFILNASWTFGSESPDSPGRLLGLYPRFLSLCVVTFLLRSGVLAAGVSLIGWPAPPLLLLAIATGAAINFLGTGLFVFPGDSFPEGAYRYWSLLTLLVVGYSVLLRGLYFELINLIPEEAYYWSWAQHLDLSYLDHPPLASWLMYVSENLFGTTEFTVRIPALLCWAVVAYFIFKLAEHWFGPKEALVSLITLSTFPIYFGIGFLITPDAPMYAAWAGLTYFFYRAVNESKYRYWLGVGVTLGLGLLGKYTIGLVVLSAAVYLILCAEHRNWYLRPEPYLAGLLATVIFSPVLIWNYLHSWASISFQGARRWSGRTEASTLTLLGHSLVTLTPAGFFCWFGLFTGSETGGTESTEEKSPWFKASPRLFAAVFSVVPFSVFLIHSFVGNSKFNWTGPVWLVLVPWIAHSVVANRPRLESRWFTAARKIFLPMVILFLVVYGAVFYFGWQGDLAALSDDPVVRLQLGSGTKRAVGKLNKKYESAKTRLPEDDQLFMVGMDKYFLSSWLNFYSPPARRSVVLGRHIFGRRSQMWSLWSTREDVRGHSVFLVDTEPDELRSQKIKARFSRLTPVEGVSVDLNNAGLVEEIYWRVGVDYKP